VAFALYNLAGLLQDLGDLAGARPLYERSLAIEEKALGPEHVRVAASLDALAVLLFETGDYAGARPLFERSLAIREKALGPEHIAVGVSLNNLALLLSAVGDYARARSCVERALAILETTLGPGHPHLAATLFNLGHLLCRTGDHAGARLLYERALAIREKALGPEHPFVAMSLSALASLLSKTGDYAEARPLYERALAIYEKALGPEHPLVADTLINQGSHFGRMGDLAGARLLYERALAIKEKALGYEHPHVAIALANLAYLNGRTGDPAEALAHALRTVEINRSQLALTAGTLAEREVLQYASSLDAGRDLLLYLALLDDEALPSCRARVFDSMVRSRAFVLDEMSARHRSVVAADDPETVGLMAEYASARERLADLTVKGLGDLEPEAYRKLLGEARQAKERTERALAERSAGFRRELEGRRIGLDEVRAALPSQSVLVAFALYVNRERASEESGVSRHPVPSYMAFVLDGTDDEPVALRIGSSEAIDALVSAWREEVSQGALNALVTPTEAEGAYREAGRALRRAVWDPVVSLVEDARTVFVVPDGALHLVSLATLPDGDSGYLVEGEQRIHYLSAERDLVGDGEAGPDGRGLLALGAPSFDEKSLFAALAPEPLPRRKRVPAVAMASLSVFRGERSSCGDFQSLEFAPLPGSAREVREIAASWKKGKRARQGRIGHAGADDLLLTGERASEAAFKALAPGREVVHLATHGFFLGEGCPSVLEGTRGFALPEEELRGAPPPPPGGENPLLLSGMALAGANHRAAAGPEEEDGILTAEEIGALDLSGVSWAVLSACSTGLGEIRTGEGVFGLQRAFAVAGVDTMILSLWHVDDRTARDWMKALYRARFAEGMSTTDAVRAADLDLLGRRRARGRSTHPYYWSGFVATGDWR